MFTSYLSQRQWGWRQSALLITEFPVLKHHHQAHNRSSINIYWALINTCWNEGMWTWRASMPLLLAKLFLGFLEITSGDADPAWLPILIVAIKCPVTFRMDSYLIWGPALCWHVWKQKLQQITSVNRVWTSWCIWETKTIMKKKNAIAWSSLL